MDQGAVVEQAEGDVAGSGGDVEDGDPGGGGGGGGGRGGGGGGKARVEGSDEIVFPEAVDAEGH